MKRRSILSVLLMLLMVVSLVGCGNKKVSTPPEVDAETTTDIQDVTEDESEESKEELTTEQVENESESVKAPTDEETVAPTQAPQMEYDFSYRASKEGYVYFWFTDPYDYTRRSCVYDVKNKTVNDISAIDETWFQVNTRYLRNNVYIGRVPNLEVEYLEDTAIIDACSGEVIYRLTDNQEFLGKAWCDNNTALIYQRDSSYKGDTYSLGIINEKGEWVMPLKSDLPWGVGEPDYRYLGDTYYFLKCFNEEGYILNSADGTLYKCPEEMEAFGYYNGKVFAKNSWRSIGFYDFKNDNFTVIQEVRDPQDAKWDNKFWDDNKYADENGFWYKMENTVYCVDANNNVKLSYDLSEYGDHIVKAVTKDYIVFWFRSPSGGAYTGIMNTKGELLFEPVNLECDMAEVLEEGVVLGTIDYGLLFRVAYFYDIQKNKIIAIDGYNEYAYCDGTNMFWSYTDKCLYKVNDLSTPIDVCDAIFKSKHGF